LRLRPAAYAVSKPVANQDCRMSLGSRAEWRFFVFRG
jgi:hypothetical protein